MAMYARIYGPYIRAAMATYVRMYRPYVGAVMGYNISLLHYCGARGH